MARRTRGTPRRATKKAAKAGKVSWAGGVKVMASIKGAFWSSYGDRMDAEVYLKDGELMADSGCQDGIVIARNAAEAKPLLEFMANCYGWTLIDQPKVSKAKAAK